VAFRSYEDLFSLYQTLDIIRWYKTTIEKLMTGKIDGQKLYTKELRTE